MAKLADLSNLDGVKVTVEEGVGRVLRATRDFAVGSTVLVEKPLLVFRDFTDLYRQFELLDVDTKAKVLDLKHTEVSTPAATRRGKFPHSMLRIAAVGASRLTGASVDHVFKLMSLGETNLHPYCDGSTCTDCMGNTQTVKCAFFSTAFKAAHSCSPNCSYSTRYNQGYMTLIATKPIASGDPITISYLRRDNGDLIPPKPLVGSTEARRIKLEEDRDFYCNCPRCVGPDYERGICCGEVGCRGIKLGTMGRNEDACSWVSWMCQECGDEENVTSRLVETESKIQHLLDGFRHEVDVGQITAALPKSIGEAIAKAAAELSPTHFLVAELYRVQAKSNAAVAASLAADLSREHRLKSAQAGTNAIRTVECAEAGCLTGASVCGTVHYPVDVCATEALSVFKDLQLAFSGDLEKHMPFIERYLPFLPMESGTQDEDVKKFADAAAQTPQISNVSNRGARKVKSTSVCAWPGCTNKQGEGRLLKCSRCKKVAYCDVNCQRAHWKAGHKNECM